LPDSPVPMVGRVGGVRGGAQRGARHAAPHRTAPPPARQRQESLASGPPKTPAQAKASQSHAALCHRVAHTHQPSATPPTHPSTHHARPSWTRRAKRRRPSRRRRTCPWPRRCGR
jgi:hypothetical protein